MSFTLPTSMIDRKVLPVIYMLGNGAACFVDNLETSIIYNAPFTVCFPERISNIKKLQNAPFLVSLSGMITWNFTGIR